MTNLMQEWDAQATKQKQPQPTRRSKRAHGIQGSSSPFSLTLDRADSFFWAIRESHAEEIADLDSLPPEALYYLGRVIDQPLVTEIYSEYADRDTLKLWTVLQERDYDVMDKIYDIEQEVLDRFPGVDVRFRVTIQSDTGPSISSAGLKIYDSK